MMKRLCWAGAVLCAAGAGLAVAQVTTGANLLRNPGFEQGDEQPDDWSFSWEYTHSNDRERGVEKEKPDWGWDDRVVHTGKRSIRIGVRRAQDDGVWTQDDVPHVPGTKLYLLRARVKTEGVVDTRATVGCVALGESNKWLGASYGVISASGTRDWELHTGYFEAHPDAVKFRVRLWLNLNYSGTGTAWFDDLEMLPTDLRDMPPIRYLDRKAMPEVTDLDRESGYAVFRKSHLEMVLPDAIPTASELADSLELAATPGEVETATFCVRALRDLGAVTVAASGLTGVGSRIPGSAVLVRPVKCLVQRGQSRWGEYADGDMLVPVIVEDTDRTTIAADTTKQFWVTLHVPVDAGPGTYQGTVAIRPEYGRERSVRLSVRVWPFTLREPEHISFGMYARFRPDLEFTEAAYRDMRAHGMTTVGLCSRFGGKMEMDGDRVQVTFDGTSALEQAIALYQKVGFPLPILWLMSRDVLSFCLSQGAVDTPRFAACYQQVIEAIVAEGKQRGWPEIIFQPLDEPYEHAQRPVWRREPEGPQILEVTRRCLEIMKRIPGVRTEEDGANGAPQHLEALYELCDIQAYHDGPVLRRGTYDAEAWEQFLTRLKRDGKEVWFYNIDITGFHPEPLRFGFGFGLYAARATGMVEWAYMTGYRPDKPNLLYEQKLPLAYRYNRTDTEAGGPTTAWEAAREGVDDYKYLHTMLTLAAELRGRGQAELADSAERDIRERLARIDFNGCTGSACQGGWTGDKGRLPTGERFVSGSYKMQNGLSFADYDDIRQAIAEWIIKLQAAP